jgi:hypothetical protein
MMEEPDPMRVRRKDDAWVAPCCRTNGNLPKRKGDYATDRYESFTRSKDRLPACSGHGRSPDLPARRLCLESIIANTSEPYDLLIFDNGSCDGLVDYLRGLRDQGLVKYLILSSQNIGKIGALKIIFQAAPGEVVAYNDDDVFFNPGWLEAHLKLLDTYPGVGMVTGFYIRRSQDLLADEATLKFAAEGLGTGGSDGTGSLAGTGGVTVTRGQLIPPAWEEEYRVNSGRTVEKYQAETANVEDVALSYLGLEALASAHHFQFLGPRRVLLDAFPADWSGKLMGQMVEIEKVIDRRGYLRLTTRQQTVRLLGNSLNEMLAEAKKIGLETKERRALGSAPSTRGGLASVPWIRRIAQGVYNRLYNFLNM